MDGHIHMCVNAYTYVHIQIQTFVKYTPIYIYTCSLPAKEKARPWLPVKPVRPESPVPGSAFIPLLPSKIWRYSKLVNNIYICLYLYTYIHIYICTYIYIPSNEK
jgi:hypothetical protein